MSLEKTKESCLKNKNFIVAVVTAVVLLVAVMYFLDREQDRQFQLEKFDTQVDVMEKWGPPRNTNNTTPPGGEKIL